MKDVAAAPDELKLRVLAELTRVLESGFATASDRQRALLRYLVTEEIEGRGPRIKAYNVATDILGRPADFDPQQDSIVRVEVGRLRQALERHYLTAGADAPLTIVIPKGQYRPVFEAAPSPASMPAQSNAARKYLLIGAALLLAAGLGLVGVSRLSPPPAPAATAPVAQRANSVVAVAPFVFSADRAGQAYVAAGLHAEIAAALAEFDWLTVVPLVEDVRFDQERPWNVDFLLRSTLRMWGDSLSATVLLLDGGTRSVRWSKRYDFPLRAGEVDKVERDIVSRIAVDVGHPFGAIGELERARLKIPDNGLEEAFVCKLRAMQYWSARRRADFLPARECYDALAGRAALDADASAALALLLLDAAVEKFGAQPKAELVARARALAERAVDLEKRRFMPGVARYSAALCLGDQATFRSVGRAFIADHANNPLALADYGLKLALGFGDAAEGLALLAQARGLSHNLLPSSVIGSAMDGVRRGAAPDLAVLGEAAFETDAASVLLAYLAAASMSKDEKETARAVSRLADIGAKTPEAIEALLDAQCWSREVRDAAAKHIATQLRDTERR